MAAVNEGMKGNQEGFEKKHPAGRRNLANQSVDRRSTETIKHARQCSDPGAQRPRSTHRNTELPTDFHRSRALHCSSLRQPLEKQAALTQIIGNITKIDIAIQQAAKLSQVGNKFGAWETVEEVFQQFPDDPPLSRARSDYATEVAPFVSALKKAEDLEERRQHGSSLAWFLKSKQIYPASVFAAEGVNRLVDHILPDQSSDLETAPSL